MSSSKEEMRCQGGLILHSNPHDLPLPMLGTVGIPTPTNNENFSNQNCFENGWNCLMAN